MKLKKKKKKKGKNENKRMTAILKIVRVKLKDVGFFWITGAHSEGKHNRLLGDLSRSTKRATHHLWLWFVVVFVSHQHTIRGAWAISTTKTNLAETKTLGCHLLSGAAFKKFGPAIRDRSIVSWCLFHSSWVPRARCPHLINFNTWGWARGEAGRERR